MTVVNPKSISGINSITTGSGSDDILTIHTNNGTERLRVDSTGTTKIVTGIVTTLTATTGIVTTLTANDVNISNKIIGIGTNGKIGIGTNIITNSDVFVEMVGSASQSPRLQFNNKPAVGSNGGEIGGMMFRNDNDSVGYMLCRRESAADDAYLIFGTQATSGSVGERLRITSGGNVEIDSFGSPSTRTLSLRTGYLANANGGTGLAAKDHSGSAADGLGVYGTDGVSIHTANAGTVHERLRIASNGGVGIGTDYLSTNATTYHKLMVEGDTTSTIAVAKIVRKNSNASNSTYTFEVDSSSHTSNMTNGGAMSVSVNSGRAFAIDGNGNVTIDSGNLIMGTNGKGIDFSATEGSGATASILDDYEEGTYTPTISASGVTYTHPTNYDLRSPSSVTNTNTVAYVKIGNMVYLQFAMFWNSSNNIRYLITLPFTARGSAYALCITPASFQVDINGDMLGTLGIGNNSTAFDTYRIAKDTGTGGHGSVPLTASSEVIIRYVMKHYSDA